MKTTEWVELPAAGTVLGEAKEKVPATFAAPPVSTELESDCPKVIEDAVGKLETTAPTFETETVTFAVAVV